MPAPGCLRHGIENLHVTRTAAEIARQSFAYVVQSGLGFLVQQMTGAQNHSRSADAALRATAF